MDDLINNIKKKLSTENLVEMMKEAKVIDNKRIKEEDVRRTLDQIDPCNLIDVEGLAAKLNKITEDIAAKEDLSRKSTEIEKPIINAFAVLSKENDDNGLKQVKEAALRHSLTKTDPNNVKDDQMTDSVNIKDISAKKLTDKLNTNTTSIFGKVLFKPELEKKDYKDFIEYDNFTGFLD